MYIGPRLHIYAMSVVYVVPFIEGGEIQDAGGITLSMDVEFTSE